MLFQTAERMAARATTHFVSVADAMTSSIWLPGSAPQQYSRIFSGFDLQPFLTAAMTPRCAPSLAFRPMHSSSAKSPRLFELKGHDDLFAAAPEIVRRFPQAVFLLVGDGPWRGRFETLARALGLRAAFRISLAWFRQPKSPA